MSLFATKPVSKVAIPQDFKFNISDSQYCCGMREVGSFRLSSNYLSFDDAFFKGVKQNFEEGISEEEEYDEDGDRISGDKVALYIATTNDGQDYVNLILEKTGWTKVSENINPNSGNTIYLWIFNLSTPR